MNFHLVFSDDDKLPTTLSELIDLVATIGDIYEEKICLRKNDVPASFWFLFDHSSEEFKRYRQMIEERRREKGIQDDQFDPVKHFEENESVLADPVVEVEIPKPKEKMVYASIDKSDSSDSDTEYMREAKERNLKSLKYKALHPNNARKKNVDSTDSDEDTDRTNDDSRSSMKRESDEASSSQQQNSAKRARKSRWGEKVIPTAAPTTTTIPITPVQLPKAGPMLSTVKRTDPALLRYAIENFGSVNLSEEDWKKAEEAYKINLLYQDMVRKRQEIDQLSKSGKFKYEYDSDEDVNGGTWEHKLRMQEMEATQLWAEALNEQAKGKHHIGDYLPPEELKKFMEKYDKSERQPDLSDYKEFKLKEDNVGFQMLQKLGWKEGQGLGAEGSGILEPVNKASQRSQNQGLGVEQADAPQPENDDEYDAYRKRMMLAYRFRPNPLNNPRRAYY